MHQVWTCVTNQSTNPSYSTFRYLQVSQNTEPASVFQHAGWTINEAAAHLNPFDAQQTISLLTHLLTIFLKFTIYIPGERDKVDFSSSEFMPNGCLLQ